jgi:hypothetical protein
MNEKEKETFEFYKDLFADQQRMFDIARDTNYSLWNALLSFNAILITVFTGFLTLAPVANKMLLLIIILTSVISAVLLIFNFKSNKDFYYKTADDYFNRIDRIEKMSDIDAQKYHLLDLKKIENRQRQIVWFENISIVLVVIQLGLIIVFIFNR